MLTKFDGLDYHFYLSSSTGEVEALKEKPLESRLMDFQETKYLQRQATLQMGENKNPEGAELQLDADNNVIVLLNAFGYETLRCTGKIFTTYLKTENKLRIQVRPF